MVSKKKKKTPQINASIKTKPRALFLQSKAVQILKFQANNIPKPTKYITGKDFILQN